MKLTITQKRNAIQIALNVLAFVILFFATGGHGSFWGFLTFNLTAAIILAEILLSKGAGTALWATKTITYIFLTYKFSHNMGTFRVEYAWMIGLSAGSFIASRLALKRSKDARTIAIVGQIFAYVIGAYMYISAIFHAPDDFTISHMGFWFVNLLSYVLLVREIIQDKKSRVDLIIPIYGITMSGIYILCMLYNHIISSF